MVCRRRRRLLNPTPSCRRDPRIPGLRVQNASQPQVAEGWRVPALPCGCLEFRVVSGTPLARMLEFLVAVLHGLQAMKAMMAPSA